MPTMLVTCPETAHLECIRYEDHPLGMLVTACTRFSPVCAIRCEATCAARLDRKHKQSTGTEEEPIVGDDTLVQIRL